MQVNELGMTPAKAIVFDLDGTLIHSAPDIHAAASVALAGIGREPLDLPTLTSFIGDGIETLVRRCLDATGGGDAKLQQITFDLLVQSYAANSTTLTRPYPGVIASLEAFQAAGVLLGMCTNKPDQAARDICQNLGLNAYFKVIAGALPDQPKKPDPRPLLQCCERMGAHPEQTLYVGDSAVDYHTARNAGIRFRLFSEGYLNDPLPDLVEEDQFSNWDAHGILVR